MDKLKQLVIDYIAKTQGKTPEEVSSLLFKTEAEVETVKDDALSGLFEWDKTRISNQTQKFETERKETYDKGYNKAKAESLAKFEGELRAKHQITEDLKGPELVDAILAKQAAASGKGEPTEDQIKRSQVYLDTIANFKKEKEIAVKEVQDKFDSREIQLKKESIFKTISDDTETFVKTLNPILSEDPKKAANQLKILKDQMKEFDYDIKEDGKKVLLKDGKVVLDEHGHPVSFEKVVTQKASDLWDFKKAEDRKGTGNNNDDAGGAGNTGYKGPVPKNETEYMDLISKTTDENTKIEITKAYTGK